MIGEFKLKDLQISHEDGEFSGPFDVLLDLLGERELDITKVALSQVTEQYLQYLESIPQNREEEIADFLVIAARLLLLKSRALLPQVALEETEGPSLEEQLKLYKQFINASKKMNQMWLDNRKSIFRVEPPRKSEFFVPPENLGVEVLHESMVQLVSRLKPPKPLPKTHIDKSITIREKILQIIDLLKKKKKVGFFDVLADAENRTEVIVSFLALLELVKQKKIGLKQKGVFGDILVERV